MKTTMFCVAVLTTLFLVTDISAQVLTECWFGAPGSPDRACVQSKGFVIKPDSVINKWATTITETIIENTGPLLSRFNPSRGDYFYGYFQGKDANVPQTALMTRSLDVRAYDTVCIGFDYVMYGADLGNLYLVEEFSQFNQLVQINVNSLSNSISTRKEQLIAAGNSGSRNWVTRFQKVDVRGALNLQVKFQITVPPNAVYADVALDNITVVAGEGNCASVSPVNGVWAEWGNTGSCSTTCGNGLQTQTRTCTVAAQNGGVGCTRVGQQETKTINCNLATCPSIINGVWAEWGNTGDCSTTCGNGLQTQSRTCTVAAQNGGVGCSSVGQQETRTINCNLGTCTSIINGVWAEWANTGGCTTSCGVGLQAQSRTCTVAAQNGGVGCSSVGQQETRTINCNLGSCSSINGQWGSWLNINSCSQTCGIGFVEQYRECNDPAPSGSGTTCPGPSSQTVQCNVTVCPRDGNWGAWAVDGVCSQTCGSGFLRYVRQCNDPTRLGNGQDCPGLATKNETCNLTVCPVDGQWSSWTDVGSCSETCGIGSLSQSRLCNDPTPVGNGIPCPGNSSRVIACNLTVCSRDGNWGAWVANGSCSRTCGNGTQIFLRQCNDPPQLGNGKPCEGPQMKFEVCNLAACPIVVNGNWGEWINDTCTVTCGGGFGSRTRYCNDPKPQNGGLACLKSDGTYDTFEQVETTCNPQPCVPPVNGQWGSWLNINSCSQTCGIGFVEQYRECNDPAPAGSGATCPGPSSQTVQCNVTICPRDGNWGAWAVDGVCSQTCGSGVLRYVRQCNDPTRLGNGQDCPGLAMKNETCNLAGCPVNGTWGAWVVGECTATCGGGFQNRVRYCDDPAAMNGGFGCLKTDGYYSTGSEELTNTCNTNVCVIPVNGNWGTWQEWSTCSVTCGAGLKYRFRSCNDPPPSNNGSLCVGEEMQGSFTCFQQPCPVNGTWGAWVVGECTATCGGGIQNRVRFCDDPAAMNGGFGCLKTDGNYSTGSEELTNTCNTNVCVIPVNGNWGTWQEWSICSATCNPGTKYRLRSCNDPPPSNNGSLCVGEKEGTITCFQRPCPAPYLEWSQWSDCTTTCGVGASQRERHCSVIGNCESGNIQQELRNCTADCRLQDCPASKPGPIDCNFETDCGWTSDTIENAWQIGKRTETNGTGPSVDHTFPTGCGHFGFFEASSNLEPTQSAYLASPFKSIQSTRQCLSFYFNKYTQSVDQAGTLKVQIWRNYGLVTVWQHSGVQVLNDPTNWQAVFVDLDFTLGENTFLVFAAQKGVVNGFRADIAIDDVKLSDGSCTGPVDGLWSPWTVWSNCSESCGTGILTRTRLCNAPRPNNNGSNCVGDDKQTKFCPDLPACPRNGGWSNWTSYTKCSATCGPAKKIRLRECSNPTPVGNGQLCNQSNGVLSMEETEEVDCLLDVCPVDGNWGIWGNFSACSVSCGDGNKTRSRLCNNPPQAGTGLKCLKSNSSSREDTEVDIITCNETPCPINGNWGDWVIDSCTVTCGGGKRDKQRVCNDPEAKYNGSLCMLSDNSKRAINERVTDDCNPDPCPRDGNWGTWEAVEQCTVTCGGQQHLQKRSCNNPTPVGSGKLCTGGNGTIEFQNVTCGDLPCPVNGSWGNWGAYVCDASATCGNVTSVRSRVCNNPPPQNGGLTCPGAATENSTCSLVVCPVNGNWGEWLDVTTCSATCNTTATKDLRRTCNNPLKQGTGNACAGGDGFTETKSVDCGRQDCPRDGNWGAWSYTSNCSSTCDVGNRSKRRECDNPTRIGTGLECLEDPASTVRISVQNGSEPCFIAHCPDPNDCTFESSPGIPTPCNFKNSPLSPTRWALNSMRTPSPSTGPSADQNYNSTSGYYYYFEASSRKPVAGSPLFTSATDYIELQNLSSHTTTRCVKFYLHMWVDLFYITDVGSFSVQQVYDNQNVTLKEYTSKIQNDWVEQSVDLPPTNGKPYSLRFTATSVSSFCDKAVDNVRFYNVACDKVGNPLA